MTRRLVSTTAEGRHVAKVYRDAETYGFGVLMFTDGKQMRGATPYHYEADDRDDAMSTAAHMVGTLHRAD